MIEIIITNSNTNLLIDKMLPKSKTREIPNQKESLEDYLKRNHLHYCSSKLAHDIQEALCEKTLGYKTYGESIVECWEDENGYLHVSNDEYCSLVNFLSFLWIQIYDGQDINYAYIFQKSFFFTNPRH